jgi:hypothetical protein
MAMTPLEFSHSRQVVRGSAVIVVSGGGRNRDSIGSLERAIAWEADEVGVIAASQGSPLSALGQRYQDSVRVVELPSASPKDGFLATNSLLAILLAVWRWYARTDGQAYTSDDEIHSVVASAVGECRDGGPLSQAIADILNKDNLFVIHGADVAPAVADLEARFTEGGIANLHMADARNFAHGRHNWFNRKANTSVLGVSTEGEWAMVSGVLTALPSTVPNAHIRLATTGLGATVEATVIAMHVAGWAAAMRRVDIGRPRIPAFGRRLYHSPVLRASSMLRDSQRRRRDVAVERKLAARGENFGDESAWLIAAAARSRFERQLHTNSYTAVVFDYDGTLCGRDARASGISPRIGEELTRLLSTGVEIAIASGRGHSLRSQLRNSLPDRWWASVVVAFYNGAVVCSLADDRPLRDGEVYEPLLRLEKLLSSPSLGINGLEVNVRPQQLTIELAGEGRVRRLWARINEVVQELGDGDLTVTLSGHTIDVVPRDVSKVRVLSKLSSKRDNVLTIGDQGGWPGNDFALMAATTSLSVDRVSSSLNTCWNLASPGVRGPAGLLDYLTSMESQGGGVRVRATTLLRR